MPLVLEPEVATALELRSILALGAPDLVDGIVDELDGVELVEGDLGFGEVVVDALDEGAAPLSLWSGLGRRDASGA